jgi:hypothetical protein
MKSFIIGITAEATQHLDYRIEAESKEIALEIADALMSYDDDEASRLADAHGATFKLIYEGGFDVDDARISRVKEQERK